MSATGLDYNHHIIMIFHFCYFGQKNFVQFFVCVVNLVSVDSFQTNKNRKSGILLNLPMVPSFDKNVTAAFVKRKFYTTVSSTVSQYKNLFLQQEILNTLHQIITLMCNSMSFVLNATFIRKLYFLELHCLQTFSLIHCYTHFS